MAEAWWKSATVYQVYPRSFADADGDGVGDLRGLISKVDYLERLGVDVVWASPFFRSPQHDNGYDISDYRDVDPLFGSLADFDALIAALHDRGMRFMMDAVINHTSDEHPWFVESRSSTDNPKRDWYWWRPARRGMSHGEQGAEPTNWTSYFAEPSWTFDAPTGEYYLHLFSRHQADLNWENPEVRREIYDMLRFWLDRGVDGLRFDVINMISKSEPLEDGPVPTGATLGDGTANFISGPRIHEFMRELRAELAEGRDKVLMTVGETPAVSVAEALKFTDPSRAELDMVFQFEHVGLDHGPGGVFDLGTLRVADLKATLEKWQTGLADRGWNSLYWCNHDQPRAVSRFGSDNPADRVASAKALATVLHLQRGTPFIYQGEELGMTNFPFESLDQFQDVGSVNYVRAARRAGLADEEIFESLRHRSRDNARTPMQWDDGPNAGFSTATPWMAVNPNADEINAAAQIDDPDSVFAHYQRLIALRHELPVVALGDFTMLLHDHDQVFAFTRRLGDEELLVMANITNTPAAAVIPNAEEWDGTTRLLVDGGDPVADRPLSRPLELEPWETCVHHRVATFGD